MLRLRCRHSHQSAWMLKGLSFEYCARIVCGRARLMRRKALGPYQRTVVGEKNVRPELQGHVEELAIQLRHEGTEAESLLDSRRKIPGRGDQLRMQTLEEQLRPPETPNLMPERSECFRKGPLVQLHCHAPATRTYPTPSVAKRTQIVQERWNGLQLAQAHIVPFAEIPPF